jgi:glucose/arabinose dehydrogenase
MTPTSRRSFVLLAWAVVLALALTLGGAGDLADLPGAQVQTIAAAPLLAPAAAPDNSIVLQPFLSGITSPVFITHAGDGTGRLFVVEQGGLIKVVKNGVVNPTPFLNVTSRIVSGGEQGLLGLAFHPQFKTNGKFYVFYTARPPANQPPPPPDPNVGSNTLAEFHVTPGGDVANQDPDRILLSIYDRAANHNGGNLAFGPDHFLYIGTGDEGGGGDTFHNSQNLNSLLAKILRIDVDTPGTPDPPGAGYSVPPDNPFVGQANIRPEIWLYGLRNPWRWSFDRATGDLIIADVGQGNWEEVDRIPHGQRGLNLGWNIREGTHCYPPGTTSCASAGLTPPVLEYGHGPECSITGGYRYRGLANPAFSGLYFYADLCSGRVWKALPTGSSWSSTEALDTTLTPVSFGEDESGELFLVTQANATNPAAIFRLVQAGGPPANCATRPRVVLQSQRIASGTLAVTLSSTTSVSVTTNELQSVAFVHVNNAAVTIGSQVDQTVPFTAALGNGTTTAFFTVRRLQAGVPMHVDIGVTDRCGVWPTFLGGGASMP